MKETLKELLFTLFIFCLGAIAGIISLHFYYIDKYADTHKLIKAIISHTYIYGINTLKTAIFLVSFLLTILIVATAAYFVWVYLIQKTHQEIKEKQEQLKKAYQKLKKEKQLFEEEKRSLQKQMQQELELHKQQLSYQAEKELKYAKKQIENEYHKKLIDLRLWQKKENYEKEKLKQRLKCLENKIKELIIKRAEKFKQTNPGRYKKEIKKAERIINKCKD